MKTIIRSILIVASLMLSNVTVCAQKNIDSLISILNEELEEARGIGAMVSIVTRDSVLYTGGIGLADRKSETPVTEDHLFRLGSISKSFTAICLIKLLRENNYTLETPITSILPEIPIDNQWSTTHPVTVAHILEHTSGFDDLHMYAWSISDTIQPSAERMVDLSKKSLYVRWQPGTMFAYSNPGYLVAGQLIEKLSGKPYADYMDDTLLSPLNMSSSGFYFTEPTEGPMSTGYHNEGGVFSKISFKTVNAGAAGDLCSTGKDMAHFLQFLLNKGIPQDSVAIIEKADFERMEVPSSTLGVKHGITGGYGLANGNSWRNGYEFHGHNGGIPGFSSRYVYSRAADIGVAVSVNANGFPDHLVDKILDYYIPADTTKRYNKSKNKISDETIEQYSGFYHYKNHRNQLLAFIQDMTAGRELVITPDSIATFDFWGSPRATYFHDEGNRYFQKGEGINCAGLFLDGNEPVFWHNSQYTRKTNKGAKWIEFIFTISASILCIIFFIYGLIQAVINFASKEKNFTLSFSTLWATSFSFIIGLFTFFLSNVVIDKTVPGFLNVTCFIATIVFFIFSLIALIIYLRQKPKGTALKIFYGLSAFLMSGMGFYLLYYDIIGLRLWCY